MHLTDQTKWPIGLRVKIIDIGIRSTWYKSRHLLIGITGRVLSYTKILLDRDPTELVDKSGARPCENYQKEGLRMYDVYVLDLDNDPDGNY